MLNGIRHIISDAAVKYGWVMEPDAKAILKLAGISVPKSHWAKDIKEACEFAAKIGYPIVAKIVSPQVVHKSDVRGVIVGIDSESALAEQFVRLSKMKGFAGIVIEEIIEGLELIVGAKIDYQFGPVILLGLGGTGVEIYHDVTIRMSPLSRRDVELMVKKLKASKLLEGYRGKPPVNMQELFRMLLSFSDLVSELADEIESIDLNPVFCSQEHCIVGDARILLPSRIKEN